MNLKQKTARRLLLASTLLLTIIVLGGGAIVLRKWQNHRRAESNRAEGLALVQKGDYPAALNLLGPYLRRVPSDREVWLSYAKAREFTEESNGSHLTQAIAAYQRAYSFDESDRQTALKLLSLYNTAGFVTEARDLAVKLRPASLAEATTDDVPVLIEEAAARLNARKPDPAAEDVCKRLFELKPTDFRICQLRLASFFSRDDKSAATAFAAELVASNPGDTRFILLRQTTNIRAGIVGDQDAVRTVLCTAAGLDPKSPKRLSDPTYTEPEVVATLLAFFDSMRMHSHSKLVLRDAMIRLQDADAARVYVRRAWQLGDLKALAEDFASVRTSAHPEIQAFLALGARDSGDEASFNSIVDLLAPRLGFYAKSWSLVLGAMRSKSPPAELLKAIDAALKENPREPVFMFLRGATLQALGRIDEARAAWRSVYDAQSARMWPIPLLRISESLLQEGRSDEAAKIAAEAIRMAGDDGAAGYALLKAQCAIVESGRSMGDPAAALKGLDTIIENIRSFSDTKAADGMIADLLPGRVVLLARNDRRAEAVQAINSAIKSSARPSGDIFRRLAAVSLREKLGVESECIEAAEASEGPTGQSAFMRALLLESGGRRADALALLKSAVDSAPAASKADWQLARARFLDLVGDPGALEAWRKLVDDQPKNLQILSAAIRTACIARDSDLVQRTITRLIEIGACDPDRPTVDVRFARVRALLFQRPTPTQRTEAVAQLRALVADAPEFVEIRRTLVDMLLLDDEPRGIKPDPVAAIEQLQLLAEMVPDPAPYLMQLAQLQGRSGRSKDAVDTLGRVALDDRLSYNERLVAIDRLILLRELGPAATAIEQLVRKAGPEPDLELVLRQADVLNRLRRDREAIELYRKAAARKISDPDLAASLALALRNLGDAPTAGKVIAQIDATDAIPYRRSLAKARYAEALGELDEATSHFEAAVAAAPDQPDTWVRYTRFCLQNRKFPAASDVAKRGLAKLPNQPDLAILAEQATIAQSGTDQNFDIERLAAAYERSPSTAPLAQALREVERARKSGQLSDPGRVAQLAAQFPDQSGVQLLAAQLLLDMQPPKKAQAAAILRPALERFPSDVGIARTATGCFAAQGDWNSAAVAAAAWRQLDRSPSADLAVAEVELALERPRQSLEITRAMPLPEVIKDDDLTALRTLNLRVRASVLLGEDAAAFQLLQTRMTQSPTIRNDIALPIAGDLVKELPAARRWIDQVAALSRPTDASDQVAVATAWSALARRFPTARDEFLRRALAVAEKLASPSAPASVHAILASTRQQLGDTQGAIAAYRDAVRIDDKNPFLTISLARLLLAPPANPAEAVTLCTAATQLSPGMPVAWATLAEAHLSVSDSLEAAGDTQGREAARAAASAALDKLRALGTDDADSLIAIALTADRLDRFDIATEGYERLIASPALRGDPNLAAMKNNLAFMLLRSGAKKDQLTRALSLAQEAVQAKELDSFLDTLGSIQLALGDTAAAQAAYRRALELNPAQFDSAASLASMLADGSPAQKDEARRLISRIKDSISKGAQVPKSARDTVLRAESKLR